MATCDPFITLHETSFIPIAAASTLRTNIYRTKCMGGLHEDILFNGHLMPHLTK